MSEKECKKCYTCEIQCGLCFNCQTNATGEQNQTSQVSPMKPSGLQSNRHAIQRPLTEERVKEIMIDMLTELGLIKKPEKTKVMKIE